MKILFSKSFNKSFSKLPRKIKDKVIIKFEIFYSDPIDLSLNNHSLSGKYSDYRSINITGDIRAIYKVVDFNIVQFIDIGSHSKLYK